MSDTQTLGLGGTPPRTITIDAADLERVESLVREITLSGTEEFYASYVARELEIEREQAHGCLVALGEKGMVETHFNVVQPETGKTVATYKLGDEIPLGEEFASEDGEFEPFLLVKSDVIVAYAVTTNFLRRCLREQAWLTRDRALKVGEIYDMLSVAETKSSEVASASRLKVGPKERAKAEGALEAFRLIRAQIEATGGS